jgi:hypothetical protein
MNCANEKVNHPKHYNGHPSGVECIEIVRHMGFNLGNALKYIWRCDLKADAIEDLKKAIWYIEDEIKLRQTKPPKQINVNIDGGLTTDEIKDLSENLQEYIELNGFMIPKREIKPEILEQPAEFGDVIPKEILDGTIKPDSDDNGEGPHPDVEPSPPNRESDGIQNDVRPEDNR